jgi:NDP-mannose synthase
VKTVILAGGKGTRLKPYTTVLPKPLMPIGDMPILEVIIRQLKSQGLDDIILAVGYLGELLMAFFGDGSKFGVNIKYSKETEPLGTAGGLGLIKDDLKQTFLMLNGDTLTTLRFRELIEFHRKQGSSATIALKKRESYIDFGLVEIEKDYSIKQYIEKPTSHHLVSMGVYVFEPHVLEYLSPANKLDFPDLIKTMIQKKDAVKGYIFEDYWLDIGRPDDYEKATVDFENMRDKFLL